MASADVKAPPRLQVETTAVRIEWPKALLTLLQKDEGETSALGLVAKACSRLGTGLTVGKGASGLGIFNNFGCYLTQPKGAAKFLSGTKQISSPSWILRLHTDGQTLHLDTYYVLPNAAPRLVGEASLPVDEYTQDLLRDKTYANLVAALVLDILPAIRKFSALGERAQPPALLPLGDEQLDNQPLHLRSLQLYTLAYDAVNRLWLPHLVGSAQVVGSGRSAQWRLTFRESPTEPLYAHDPAGPGSQRELILGLLAARQKALLHDQTSNDFLAFREGAATAVRFALINTVDSGYVGIRVGKELLATGAILPQGTVIGVIGEERVGPLAGLRVYYDTVPRHGSTVNGQALWVQWSRLVAGYNFNLEVPWVIDKVEFAPKIGVWNVNSRLPEFSSADTIAYRDFVLSNALSLGYEAGAVWESTDLLFRLWYGRDLSIPTAKAAGVKSTVTSSRIGLDGLFKGPPVVIFTKAWRLSYLIFIYHEDLTFTQQSQQDGHFSLEFSSAYAGGGLSLAW